MVTTLELEKLLDLVLSAAAEILDADDASVMSDSCVGGAPPDPARAHTPPRSSQFVRVPSAVFDGTRAIFSLRSPWERVPQPSPIPGGERVLP